MWAFWRLHLCFTSVVSVVCFTLLSIQNGIRATARLEGMETLPKTWILNQLQHRAWPGKGGHPHYWARCECESTWQDDESRSNIHVLVYWESKLHKPSFPTIVISMFMSTSLFFIEGMCVEGLSSWRPRNSFRKETSPTHGVPYFPLNPGCLIGIRDPYNGFL